MNIFKPHIIYLIIGILCILLNNLLWYKLYKKKPKIKQITNDITIKQVQEDLMNIINYKCFVAKQRILQPLIDKGINHKPLINDKLVNSITIQIVKELINELSDDYKAKLSKIYSEDSLEDVLLELVYNVITEMSLNINKRTIKKLNVKNTFNNIIKKDFDK